jgi:hypothetical protein
MKACNPKSTAGSRRVSVASRARRIVLAASTALLALPAQASMFQGETLDKVADVMTWIVLVIAPVIAIGVFLLIHILPEKIAEKKQHPQTHAIQCLCLLSLVFGGMLWPIAWLWAYTKPVLHEMAYGTDQVPLHEEPKAGAKDAKPSGGDEVTQLRARIHELENKLAGAAQGGKG